MRIKINDIPLELGRELPEADRAEAGLRRPPVWDRLPWRTGGGGRRLDVANCTVDAFDGTFRLYPCMAGYLDRDRQWRTAVSVFVDEGKVRSVLVRVIEGRYAATEFADRFRDAAAALLGEGHAVDGFTRRWKNGRTACVAALQPDGRNACFIIETTD
jgi:hypothetical protein